MNETFWRCIVLLRYFLPASYYFIFHNDYKTITPYILKAGPMCIKLGQWLSTRRDILPHRLCDTLQTLQSHINFHSPGYSRKVIESEMGGSIADMFASFEKKPFNSGSIAQVHRAVMKNGDSVVVKVIHPHVKKQLLLDYDILNWFSRFSVVDFRPIMKQIVMQSNLKTEAAHVKSVQN